MVQLLKIEDVKHLDASGSVLWEQQNVGNVFHADGQYFVLSAVFCTSNSVAVPASYYIGLDARSSPQASDTQDNLSGEPTQNGYTRVAVSSATGFVVDTDDSGNYRATSSLVTFSASGGSWGPVKNIFLATTANTSGYLISTSALSGPRLLTSGESLVMRVSLGLGNC